MAERPPATDLRGGNTSEDSFTMWTANLVAAYAVDFQSDPFSSVALGLTVRPEGFSGLVCVISVTGCGGAETTLPV